MKMIDKISIGARVHHSVFGEGIVFDLSEKVAHVFFRDVDREIARSFKGVELIAPAKKVARAPKGS